MIPRPAWLPPGNLPVRALARTLLSLHLLGVREARVLADARSLREALGYPQP